MISPKCKEDQVLEIDKRFKENKDMFQCARKKTTKRYRISRFFAMCCLGEYKLLIQQYKNMNLSTLELPIKFQPKSIPIHHLESRTGNEIDLPV